MTICYVQNMSVQGRMRNLPGFRDPLVTIRRGNVERAQLMEGLKRLIEALFAAGATTVFPFIAGYPPLPSPPEFPILPDTPHQSYSHHSSRPLFLLIGRESCMERVCPAVLSLGVAQSLKKKQNESLLH